MMNKQEQHIKVKKKLASLESMRNKVILGFAIFASIWIFIAFITVGRLIYA